MKLIKEIIQKFQSFTKIQVHIYGIEQVTTGSHQALRTTGNLQSLQTQGSNQKTQKINQKKNGNPLKPKKEAPMPLALTLVIRENGGVEMSRFEESKIFELENKKN